MKKIFLGRYELDNKEYFYIYDNDVYGWAEWHKNTFSPTTENIDLLTLKITGKTYEERKNNLQDLAINYSHNFGSLSWSYGELAEIGDFFYRNGKKYGLLREFHENGIC
jgi:hypothetical protein